MDTIICADLAKNSTLEGSFSDALIRKAYTNRYLMTDFIRRIRQRLDEVGAQRGKHLDLLVRVPPTLYDSQRIGLDVEAWIGEGLVDIVAAGGGFMPFEQPSLANSLRRPRAPAARSTAASRRCAGPSTRRCSTL